MEKQVDTLLYLKSFSKLGTVLQRDLRLVFFFFFFGVYLLYQYNLGGVLLTDKFQNMA